MQKSSTLSLVPVTGDNPFAEYLQLRTIWPAPFQGLAEDAAQEALTGRSWSEVSQAERHTAGAFEYVAFGGLFLIVRSGAVIGITGYFYAGHAVEPYLRWHGLVPSYRGKGHSWLAMGLLITKIKAENPTARGLTELVPQTGTSHGREIAAHFDALGFVPVGAPESYEWSDCAWQPYRLELG